MQARRAARELSLLTLFQWFSVQIAPKKGDSAPFELPDKTTLQYMMRLSVLAMEELAREKLESAAFELQQVSIRVMDMEAEDLDNLNLPVDRHLQEIPLPKTRDTVVILDRALAAMEILHEALNLPSLVMYGEMPDVHDYAMSLMTSVVQHQAELTKIIEACCDDWRFDRLIRVDRLLLLIATAEIKYIKGVDAAVSINEAVELAKKYSTEESFRFINGILGKIASQSALATAHPVSDALSH
jgi:transcription antitermination protein NusB